MNLDVLLITNYKAKQLNEFKLLLARTMKLSKTDDWSMHVRTVKDKHWLTIRSGNKKARLLLLALPLMFSDKTEFYNDLNFKAEKYLFTEEWIYGLKDKPGLEQVIGSTNQEFFLEGMCILP
ncbi:hypothetical protein [Secundilactobacillus oryzae]|uniref:hypothetical protein n=1 Tax=Secundilactobacillus oryzae TaxID=1202668 RepID=UPI0006D2BE81|nr:hypothetical protein [Secundilactobacillus oryzae]